jgi:hypothetical protein
LAESPSRWCWDIRGRDCGCDYGYLVFVVGLWRRLALMSRGMSRDIFTWHIQICPEGANVPRSANITTQFVRDCFGLSGSC